MAPAGVVACGEGAFIAGDEWMRLRYPQDPVRHVAGATHVVPHEPQLVLLVVTSTQSPEQLVNGAAHKQSPPTNSDYPRRVLHRIHSYSCRCSS